MVYDRKRDTIEHGIFSDIVAFLAPSDLLVRNDTRVLPARLEARKPSGGRVEVLLLAPVSETDGSGMPYWEVWVRGRVTERLIFEGGVCGRLSEEVGRKYIHFELPEGLDFHDFIARWGRTPLPPYILKKRGGGQVDPADSERYQTVYARHGGSVAAPTAGLHFTEALLGRIQEKGVRVASVTLHIGAATFQPIRAETLNAHVMHKERFKISMETAGLFNTLHARNAGALRRGRVVAVGSTVTRALESAIGADGLLSACEGETTLFITPGYTFQAVDALITNFHLPRSTLLVLVSAFAGRDAVQRIYQEAIQKRYRFYSFGDAMLIV